MTPMWLAVLGCVYLCFSSVIRGQQQLKAEGLFIVDKEAVESYMEYEDKFETYKARREKAVAQINNDLAYFFSEVNRIFLSFQPALKIDMYLKKVIILNESVFPATAILPGKANAISSSKSLDQFEDWLVAKKYYSTYKYDFAYLYTGYNLHGIHGSTGGGIANMGDICDPKKAIGIGEFFGTYVTASVTAHEIGHILGADHTDPTSEDIMTSVVDSANRKRWTFSKISINEIKKVLSELSPNCLLTTDPKSTKPSIKYTAYKGELLDPDKICHRSEKSIDSQMCKSWVLYDNKPPTEDAVCLQIYCAIPNTDYCKSAYSSDGMVCASGKRCTRGKCLPEATAPKNLLPNCTFGDQNHISDESIKFTGSCEDYLKEEGEASCYDKSISQKCCKACHSFHSGIKGCEYGDRSYGCTTHEKGDVCEFSKHQCCSYCRGFKAKRTPRPSNKTIIVIPLRHRVNNYKKYPIQDKGVLCDTKNKTRAHN